MGRRRKIMSDIAKSRLSNEKDLSSLSQCYLRKENKIIRSSTIKKDYIDLDRLPYYDFSDFLKAIMVSSRML